jgi:plastocyanin
MRNPVKRTLALLTAAPVLAGLLAGCGGGSDGAATDGAADSVTTTGAPGAQTATIGMNDKLRFVPTTVEAKVGKVGLEVKNLGRVPHNLHFDEASLGKTRTIDGNAAETMSLTFAKAGTFTFECTFHSGMTGKVVVS